MLKWKSAFVWGGKLKKDLGRWTIPTKLRRAHKIRNRDEILIQGRFGRQGFSIPVQVVSGGEFYLPEDVAVEITAYAKLHPLGHLKLRAVVPGQTFLSKANQLPEDREYTAEQFRRNRADVVQLKEMYNWTCQITGELIPTGIPKEIVEVHHIKWLSRGGSDDPSNMIVVSPNMHRAIHAADGILIWEDGDPVYEIGRTRFRLKANEHLVES